MSDKELYKICQGDGPSIPVRKSIVDDKYREGAMDKLKQAVNSESMVTWNHRFIGIAKTYASFSKDPSTKTGAIIVNQDRRIVSGGFNGFPAGVIDTEERLNYRPTKYKLTLHAEVNAILSAKQNLTGCTIFVYPLPPCLYCALLIIQSGISKVVAPKLLGSLIDRWGNSCREARELFSEAGVEYIEL